MTTMSQGIGAPQVTWTLHESMLYARTIIGDVCHHLVVERLPTNKKWEWVVWALGTSPETARRGVTPSAETAMAQAQACVRNLAF
jgi:hypothetical protein